MTESLAPACGREAVSRVLKLCSGMWIGGSPGASGLSRPSLHLRYRRRTLSPRRQRWLTTPPYDPEPCLAYLEQDCAVAAVGRLISWKCCYACSAKTICSLLRHLPLQQWRALFGGNDAVAAVWSTFAGALLWQWDGGPPGSSGRQAVSSLRCRRRTLSPRRQRWLTTPPLPLVAWSFALACGRGGSLAYPARRTGAQDAVASSSAVSAQAFELAVSRPALPSRARVTAPAPEVMALASQDQVAQSCGA